MRAGEAGQLAALDNEQRIVRRDAT